jgi:hypothetical protein
MNKADPKRTFRPACRWAVLVLLIFAQSLRAQDMPGRFLFIFDTSSDMKNRIKAEQLEVNQLLATSMGGQLQEGDSIGVWTFDQTLHAGQFPLVSWAPDSARDTANGINKFLDDQHYSGNTSFAALQPVLGQVMQSSPRLTIIIFCDGEDAIKWTPYNDGVNQLFQERKSTQEHTKQPFILLIRSQLGQFAGCTMNFPPGMLNFPSFPPMPLPPQANPALNQPAPKPLPPAPVVPLIIVGTNVMDQGSSPENAGSTNAPPPVVTVTNVVTTTNTVTLTQTNTVMFTNTPPVATSDNSHFNRKEALAVGAGLLIAAAGLIALAVSRSRRADRTSLITHSMRKD